MMGKGAEGGCASNGCGISTNLLPLSKGLVQSGSVSRMRGTVGQGLDVFSQALKSLAIKPAFGELGSSVTASGSLNAPISNENRRKQRVKRNDISGTLLRDAFENTWFKDSNGGPFWLQMEEYFRVPTSQDIQLLLPKTKLDTWALCNSFEPVLQMPLADKKALQQEPVEDALLLTAGIKGNTLPCSIHFQENQGNNVDEQIDAAKLQEQRYCTKRKLVVSSGSTSKRRKLTSSAFEVVTAVISPPENGDEELCHVCNGGDSDDQNKILFCDSCNVAVHQDCYGIKVVPEEQWLCSMCTYRSDTSQGLLSSGSRDCVLCPVKGGALKPIASLKDSHAKDPPNAAFVHLFCCQWIPETYIGDMEMMEPIMNVEGVREERRKLLCIICKDKHGACIQCSHGMCATAFHPLCARQAKLRMEVSSKADGDELDFRAFCSKHKMQGGKSLPNMYSENGSEHGSLDSAETGVISRESHVNKVCKKLKTPTTGHEDNSMQAGIGGALINSVGFMKNNLFTRRGIVMNGVVGSDLVKGSMGRTDSIIAALGNALDTDTDYLKTNLMEPSIANAQDFCDEVVTPNDKCQGKKLSECVVNKHVQFSDLGSSCSSASHKPPPFPPEKCSTKAILSDEKKENALSNSKDTSGRTFRNKRRKLEQQVLSQAQPTEETSLRGNQGGRSVDVGGSLVLQGNLAEGFESQILQDDTSMPDNQCADALMRVDEERRQRGLSGEASTSQDFPSTSQRPAQLASWENVSKTSEVEVDSVSVIEQNRLQDWRSLHPFLITKLLEAQNDIAERGSVNEHGKGLDPFHLPDNVLASASPFIEVQHVKVPRSKRYQFQGFVHKRNLASKSGKNGSSEFFEAQLKQLEYAKKTGILDMAPENDLEAEILALQLSLIAQAQGNHDQCEQLVLKIIPSLSTELRTARRRSDNLAQVNHYLSLLREAKKQGRKERRSKEAQAILAAANAVAAGSSRAGALRKDDPGDEKPYVSRDSFGPPVMATSYIGGVPAGRPALPKPTSYGWTSSSQTSSCGKANSIEQDIKALDSRNSGCDGNSGESREQVIPCDICKDPSFPDPTIICHRCKVAVHHRCYGIDVFLSSDWQCQPCTEITREFQGLKAPDVTNRATSGPGVLCSICLGRAGAFKRYSDKWAHVFCVQWVPQGIADKDDGGLHEPSKLASLERILHECSVCHMKQGVRLRCSFGHCHGAFHPLCARDSGLYMNVKWSAGGRTQNRAYCEKHSSQQRQKAASKKYGSSDELNMLLQMRAELERVRILCERVCKRERIKRDRLLCTLDVYTAHLSSLSSSAMASNDLSSTSNTLDTTFAFHKMSSLNTRQNDSVTAKPHHHGLESESYSWNSVAGEGNKYQDSLSGDSVYQTQISCSEPSRETPARSQLSDAAAIHGGQARLNVFASGAAMPNQKRPGRHQKAETLHTEVVMTPTEASVQNQRLPKGYAYVPVGTLPKGKLNQGDVSAVKDL